MTMAFDFDIRAASNKSWHVTADGAVYVDGVEFEFPLAENSIKVEQIGKGRHHLVTLTIIAGSVTMDQRPPRGQLE